RCLILSLPLTRSCSRSWILDLSFGMTVESGWSSSGAEMLTSASVAAAPLAAGGVLTSDIFQALGFRVAFGMCVKLLLTLE
nr:hypothetical protein [Tanacetum cinerariifolium]